MSDFKVSRDSTSGALLLERDLASHEKRTVKLTLTFHPVGLWMKFKCWMGVEFPGPVLAEISINTAQMRTFEKRLRTRTKVFEEIVSILDPGRGKIKILLSPEDFQGRWKVTFRLEPLYN